MIRTNAGRGQIHYDLTADFAVGDRRLEDRTDIEVRFVTATLVNGRKVTIAREIYLEPTVKAYERRQLALLCDLLSYLDFADGSWWKWRKLRATAGRTLREIRELSAIGEEELAVQLSSTPAAIRKWESGAAPPGPEILRNWWRALGLFSAPKSAIVRVVDISPQLLRALRENPRELQTLSPEQFETFIANRLDRMGYNVCQTGPTFRSDGGIDIIATPKAMNVGSIVLAAQVKHHRDGKKTGREAVDRLAAWKGTSFGVGLLATNTSFTKDAVWAASQERNAAFLRLRDFEDLKRWLEERLGEEDDWREIPDRIELTPGFFVEIPKPKLVEPPVDLFKEL